jgi:uncharacterized protein (TIGR03083 family)
MATVLPLSAHLATLAAEADRFHRLVADATDLSAVVPTCPEWSLRELVAHQGEVHRWATDTVTGVWADLSDGDRSDRIAAPLDPALARWFADGTDALLTALEAAPDDLVTPVFLLDAPPARTFWARRQANETTVHRVDALAAVLGRTPTTAEADIAVDRAVDGIDELLTGFVPRRRSTLRSAEPFTIAVAPTDSDRRWLLAVGDGPVVTTRPDADVTADAVFAGTAAALWLALWNRGDDVTATGRPGTLSGWREQVRVSWH